MNDISIVRNDLKFEGRFTQIPNEWARDPRVGFRAKGVLLYLMSHKSGWKTSIEHLTSLGPDGRDAIRTAIAELEMHGYLVRKRLRNKGQLAGAEWVLQDPFDEQAPITENPIQENPVEENPMVKKTNSKKTNQIEKQKNTNNLFEDFWLLYPRKTGKGLARTAYEKALLKTDEATLLKAVESYAQDPNLPEDQFVPHASTWLNQERWTDGALPARSGMKSSSDNARNILAMTQNLLTRGEVREIGH